MSLLPSERAQYSAIIDGILANSDLQTISAKQIRKGLQAKLGIDITGKKDVVQQLIMERFDKASSAEVPEPTPQAVPIPQTNGHHKSSSNNDTIKSEPHTSTKIKSESKTIKSETPISTPSSLPLTASSASASISAASSDVEDPSPPKKKRKTIAPTTPKPMNDAQLAAMLQAQENQNSRTRATRGGGTKRKPIAKRVKKEKKKSADRVKAEEDSDMELDSQGEVKEKVKKGGFHKLYHLSAPLADLVGESSLSRPQVVKKIWAHIKANDLQDPADKRQIRCDEKMQSVFKQDKVHMFTMNKLLGKQLYPIEE